MGIFKDSKKKITNKLKKAYSDSKEGRIPGRYSFTLAGIYGAVAGTTEILGSEAFKSFNNILDGAANFVFGSDHKWYLDTDNGAKVVTEYNDALSVYNNGFIDVHNVAPIVMALAGANGVSKVVASPRDAKAYSKIEDAIVDTIIDIETNKPSDLNPEKIYADTKTKLDGAAKRNSIVKAIKGIASYIPIAGRVVKDSNEMALENFVKYKGERVKDTYQEGSWMDRIEKLLNDPIPENKRLHIYLKDRKIVSLSTEKHQLTTKVTELDTKNTELSRNYDALLNETTEKLNQLTKEKDESIAEITKELDDARKSPYSKAMEDIDGKITKLADVKEKVTRAENDFLVGNQNGLRISAQEYLEKLTDAYNGYRSTVDVYDVLENMDAEKLKGFMDTNINQLNATKKKIGNAEQRYLNDLKGLTGKAQGKTELDVEAWANAWASNRWYADR